MRETCYKLTNQAFETKNSTKWGEGVTHETDGKGGLCSSGWLHAYSHPLLAVLLNILHADIAYPVLWEAVGEGSKLSDRGLKVGYTKLTTLHRIPVPVVTTEQHIRFGIGCALAVYSCEAFKYWAENWLLNTDRSERSAAEADKAATAAANAATGAYAVRASYAACCAANAAANAAAAAAKAAANITVHASYAAYCTAYAADAAANATTYATDKRLIEIAEWAVSMNPLFEPSLCR